MFLTSEEGSSLCPAHVIWCMGPVCNAWNKISVPRRHRPPSFNCDIGRRNVLTDYNRMRGVGSRLKFKCFPVTLEEGIWKICQPLISFVIVHLHYTYIRRLYTQKIKIFSFSWRALNIYPHLDKLFTTRIRNLQNFCFVFCTKSFQSNILFS